jgi:hypothetical protein
MEEALTARGAMTYVATRDQVRAHTPFFINQRIDQATMKRIWFYATQPRAAITRRIQEVDQEWDVERLMATKTSAIGLFGLFMGVFGKKRWLLVPGIALGCLLQHALWRTTPAVVLLRRLGVRTRREIDAEKYALRILRGDFDSLKNISEDTHKAIEALRLSRL